MATIRKWRFLDPDETLHVKKLDSTFFFLVCSRYCKAHERLNRIFLVMVQGIIGGRRMGFIPIAKVIWCCYKPTQSQPERCAPSAHGIKNLKWGLNAK
jgi:hypothetical protein